jgi:hypothetical protein
MSAQLHHERVEYTPEAYDSAEQCDWPAHIDQKYVLSLAERYAPEYGALSDADFNAEGVRLGGLLSGEHSAYLADEIRCDSLNKRERALFDSCVDTLARAIALGSCMPEGIKLFGVHVRYTDG